MFKALKKAFPHTLPIMAGYIFLGITFGFLMKTSGYPIWYPIVMSIFIYSGALQFAAIPMLSAPFDPIGSFVMGLMLSARHLFYGIPLLKKYEDAGALKVPMMLTLTDETFSVSSSIDPPVDIMKKYFYASISFLNYAYWIIGTCLGALFGKYISFDSSGVEFALTALFIVLFIEQLKTREGKISGLIGLVSSALTLIIFGSSKMVIISMAIILFVLLVFRKRIEHE